MFGVIPPYWNTFSEWRSATWLLLNALLTTSLKQSLGFIQAQFNHHCQSIRPAKIGGIILMKALSGLPWSRSFWNSVLGSSEGNLLYLIQQQYIDSLKLISRDDESNIEWTIFHPKWMGQQPNKDQETKSNVTTLTTLILTTSYHPLSCLKTPIRVTRTLCPSNVQNTQKHLPATTSRWQRVVTSLCKRYVPRHWFELIYKQQLKVGHNPMSPLKTPQLQVLTIRILN